ncbi:hypothetical protein [Nocardia sp. NPDC057440]|uniref:hypothetical protein n=1 Tax=Nocardia sp. NPDC057440 TaxID=3346134 RepID=UPI00366ADDA3
MRRAQLRAGAALGLPLPKDTVLVNTRLESQVVAEMRRIIILMQDKALPGGHQAFAAGGEHWTAWIDNRFAGIPATATTYSR